MLQRLILAVVVGVLVTLGCILLGGILITLKVALAVSIGNFLGNYSGVLGVLAALWHFFAGSPNPLRRA